MAKCQVNKNRRRKAARKMVKFRKERRLQRFGQLMGHYIREELDRPSFARQFFSIEECSYSYFRGYPV
jgi:hypothetical protein